MDLQDTRQRTLAGLLVAAALFVAGWQFLQWWTRPTAVEFDNLKYIQLLTTAVSSRSSAMLAKVETAISQRRDAGEMSNTEFEHFRAIIGIAREDRWQEADRACFEFAKAQLDRSRSRPPSSEHSHEHEHDHNHGETSRHPHAGSRER